MKTLSRSYDTFVQARAAVDAIEQAGVPSSDVSLIASREADVRDAEDEAVSDTAAGAGVGGVVGGSAGLLAGLGLLAIPGLGPVVAAGWLAAAAVGAAAGVATGGIVGALFGAGVDEEQAAVHSEAIRRGGALVAVRVPDDQVGRIEGLLSVHRPVDLAARAACWQRKGGRRSIPTRHPIAAPRPRRNANAANGATRNGQAGLTEIPSDRPARNQVEARAKFRNGGRLVGVHFGKFLGQIGAIELIEMQVGGGVIVRQGVQRVVQVEQVPMRRSRRPIPDV